MLPLALYPIEKSECVRVQLELDSRNNPEHMCKCTAPPNNHFITPLSGIAPYSIVSGDRRRQKQLNKHISQLNFREFGAQFRRKTNLMLMNELSVPCSQFHRFVHCTVGVHDCRDAPPEFDWLLVCMNINQGSIQIENIV